MCLCANLHCTTILISLVELMHFQVGDSDICAKWKGTTLSLHVGPIYTLKPSSIETELVVISTSNYSKQFHWGGHIPRWEALVEEEVGRLFFSHFG